MGPEKQTDGAAFERTIDEMFSPGEEPDDTEKDDEDTKQEPEGKEGDGNERR